MKSTFTSCSRFCFLRFYSIYIMCPRCVVMYVCSMQDIQSCLHDYTFDTCTSNYASCTNLEHDKVNKQVYPHDEYDMTSTQVGMCNPISSLVCYTLLPSVVHATFQWQDSHRLFEVTCSSFGEQFQIMHARAFSQNSLFSYRTT